MNTQSETPPPGINRGLIASLIGIGSALLCWLVLKRFQLGAADFTWAIRAAQDLLAGRDPYDYAANAYAIPYPLTAALIGLPFVCLPLEGGGALFFGLSSTLLAWGLTREGYTRLLIFLAYPYWGALITAQWSPHLATVAFFPALLPLVMAKPHIGLPVALAYLTQRGVLLCLVFGVVSLLVMPSWPFRWLSQVSDYQRFIPVLVLPGPLLLLALLRVQSPDARLLLLAAVMPQRWFYDGLILWLIPKTAREILVTTLVSWATAVWHWNVMPASIARVGLWSVLCLYLPMLAVILLRKAAPQTLHTLPTPSGGR